MAVQARTAELERTKQEGAELTATLDALRGQLQVGFPEHMVDRK